METALDFNRSITASLLRLRVRSPFFATLALFARVLPSATLSTAATNGKDIFFNPEFLSSLPPAQLDGVLLHEVLHAALLHVLRRGTRQPQLWNVAADIVVNGAISEQNCFQLPEGAIRDPKLEKFSVEEIYELLLKNPPKNCTCNLDLLEPSGEMGGDTKEGIGNSELEAHWKAAVQQAIAIARTAQQGSIPASLQRELGTITEPQLDWRTYLWRYLVRTPNDFTGFDRRFLGRGLYLETLEGETVQVFVGVDTSGSISETEMRLFLSEVSGILSAYPHLTGELYYVDAEAYGPYPLNPKGDIPTPVGGGGTSFIPFFDRVFHTDGCGWDGQSNGVCVYLTDGYGAFPSAPPPLPVLWVITPGGLDSQEFPFGETVRLSSF
ncbi:VWA-like domain-containing protein [Oscillatoria sp. FACHB-1406]|uniref:vWA domain-containing protein n=1 Tax=Oscillatoria sp. FACHB-1406 TaxID=2692846 RepID=UPI00168630EC|nr:VWA-like domain-containing protein [Oscillatoria sp. FACHB-1406]MBD2577135.1 hypothetical protein [Oscillatoria sp. FACHB-1406]